jgi:hypothetical protein
MVVALDFKIQPCTKGIHIETHCSNGYYGEQLGEHIGNNKIQKSYTHPSSPPSQMKVVNIYIPIETQNKNFTQINCHLAIHRLCTSLYQFE